MLCGIRHLAKQLSRQRESQALTLCTTSRMCCKLNAGLQAGKQTINDGVRLFEKPKQSDNLAELQESPGSARHQQRAGISGEQVNRFFALSK